ncbi:MAG TPA: class I fructose-bisphosphate aldolase [Vicinamibacterales bacterium]|nr:class I fructose-bisphosphate aldolase [Vicinamibacterales bacterium]
MTTTTDLEMMARTLVAGGKGILAADETPGTLTRRLDAFGLESTPDSRRRYREMFFTAPGIGEFISGVILQDETIHQTSSKGTPLADILIRQGIVPGIKVDRGAKPLAAAPGELITEGLDGLRDRLKDYVALGARFAKWRAVLVVSGTVPSRMCVEANAHALARYAALCQEQGLVPIVEPEVLMEGSHGIERSEEVTGTVLQAVFEGLVGQRVILEGMLLKSNMVIAGRACAVQASVSDVAQATVRCLRRHVPPAVPGIVFLSGGQDHRAATMHLSAINQVEGPRPWKLSFSYGRALQDEALRAWQGEDGNLQRGQQAFYHRAKCDSAAALGSYTSEMEPELAGA